MSVDVKSLCFAYGERSVLNDLSFSVTDGDLAAVLGPNGVGKSTLFQCLLGFLKPRSGAILLGGRNVADLSRRELAREIAYIPQSAAPVFNYTVLDSVLMGFTGQIGLFAVPEKVHREKAMQVLESLGIAHLAHRGCNRISGGERQLMLIARSLVQNARVLIMDEPTASLDYGNAFRVMERIQMLGREGYAVIFSTHEPNQAFRFANRVLALKDGRILADGAPETVLTEETLSALYSVGVAVREVEVGKKQFKLSLPFSTESES
ncbi:MAG: ABC transporter ATP-binding protein [Oscillospiraceae bacterium]